MKWRLPPGSVKERIAPTARILMGPAAETRSLVLEEAALMLRPINPPARFSRRKCLLLVVACPALLALAVSARAWLSPAAPTAARPATRRALPAAPAREAKELLPSEQVTITPRGFEPSELTRPSGRFFLSVENRSRRRGLTLVLDPEHGNRVREYTEPEGELDWTDELQLTPGRYTLTTRERPDWVCQIIVTPQ
jgi:hypothetical protein